MKLFGKFLGGFVAAFLLAAGIVAAGNYPPVPYLSGPVDSGNFQGTVNGVINSINTNNTGLLFVNAASAATTAAATEQTLYTYTLSPSYLATNGQSLRVRCWATTANNTNTKAMTLYFGASTVTVAAQANATNGDYLEYVVTRTGAATQVMNGTGQGGTTAGATTITAVQNATPTETLSGAIVIKCTGTQGTAAANDIVGKMMTVESLR
jgi:hypothetical protein